VLYCLQSASSEDLFKRLNVHFPIFDPMLSGGNPALNMIPECRLKEAEGEYLSYDDLPSDAKAEALIPILVSSCLHLPTSDYKHAIQDVFGRMVFHARSSLCGYHVTRKGSPSSLTVEATSHLHGRSLSSFIGSSEEAFIRFVIITDFLRYHFATVSDLAVKYRHLLSGEDNDGCVHLSRLLETYEGVRGSSKLEKGFRDSDIRYYQSMKSVVMDERRAVKDSPPTPHDCDSGNQLIFHYPFSSQHQVKVEATISSSNKKRKATGDLVGDRDTVHRQNLAMSLDDDDDDFSSTDYNAVAFVRM
jgi:hypothetical protein